MERVALQTHGGGRSVAHDQCVAAEKFAGWQSRESVTAPSLVHLDVGTWRRVSQMAEEERRPISQLLRNIVTDAIGAQGRAKPEGSAAGSAEAA
jgi:hypothetical protein